MMVFILPQKLSRINTFGSLLHKIHRVVFSVMFGRWPVLEKGNRRYFGYLWINFFGIEGILKFQVSVDVRFHFLDPRMVGYLFKGQSFAGRDLQNVGDEVSNRFGQIGIDLV